jgi:hypothetical protein
LNGLVGQNESWLLRGRVFGFGCVWGSSLVAVAFVPTLCRAATDDRISVGILDDVSTIIALWVSLEMPPIPDTF